MVGHRALNKTTAKRQAAVARQKGFLANIYKKTKGWGVSVRRK